MTAKRFAEACAILEDHLPCVCWRKRAEDDRALVVLLDQLWAKAGLSGRILNPLRRCPLFDIALPVVGHLDEGERVPANGAFAPHSVSPDQNDL